MKISAFVSLSVAALVFSTEPARAGEVGPVDLSGDLRLRLDQDWDSQTATGAMRSERTRARVRVRLNAKADLGSGIVVKGRVRTGGEGSQQNANITFKDFDGNPEDTLKITPDRYSVAWRNKSIGIEAGRMAFPFFTPNEYLWDGDISPLGVAANGTIPLHEKAQLALNAGAFQLPVGLFRYSGNLYAGQVVVESGPARLAAGIFRFEADRRDADRLRLLDANGSRDYTILAVNAQYCLLAGGSNLVLGADFYRNLQDYTRDSDPVSEGGRNQRTGFVLSGIWGDTNAPHHAEIAYRYFRMERLAVNASYAHDDVARFGTAAQAALTDLKGHDLFVNYALTHSLTVGARAFMVRRLTSREDGKRARIDLIWSF